MNTLTRFAKFSLALAFLPALFAQSASSPGLGGVSSTYSLGNSTFNSVQYTVTISIDYNNNVPAANYISPAQLTSDYQGFLNAYPNPGDPPEAILLAAVQGFAQKYSQFAGVSLDAVAGSVTALQAEILITASNVPAGALDRHANPHKVAKH
jgi:hypothetical protein